MQSCVSSVVLKFVRTHARRWVTRNESCPLPPYGENCAGIIEITDEDILNSVRKVPRIESLVHMISSKVATVFHYIITGMYLRILENEQLIYL